MLFSNSPKLYFKPSMGENSFKICRCITASSKLFLLRPPTKPFYCDVTMHTLYFFEGKGNTLRPVTKKDEKGKDEKWTRKPVRFARQFFHPRADGPFTLYLPFFFRHRKDTLV